MKPAASVILLTTLIGAGQGLFLALFTHQSHALFGLARQSAGAALYGAGSLLAAALLAAGLIASFFHLGRPERAWRTAAQWRTSWLSREVIVLPAFMATVLLYAATFLGAPNPEVLRLFPNYREIEKEYYKRTKIYPIMHLVAIKKSVYEKYPFVATSLFNAFQRAKEIALERMYNERALRYMLPWLPRDIDEIHEYFGGDPWPYGVEKNRPTLEALVQYLQDQHLIAYKPTLEELFAPIYGLE